MQGVLFSLQILYILLTLSPTFTHLNLLLDDFKSATVLDYLIDILSFCVEHHSYHIKNYILSKDLLRRILVLMKSRHKFLSLGKLSILFSSASG